MQRPSDHVRRSRLGVWLAGTIMALTATGFSPAAAETWQMYTYIPNTDSPVGAGLRRIVDRVKAETAGELTIQLHLGGSLPIKVTDIGEAVGANIVQIGADSFVSGHVPIAGVARLPMLVADRDLDAVMGVVRPRVEEAFARLKVKLLGYYVWDRIHIYATRPLAGIGDLAGRKVRQGSPESADLIRSGGGVPITIGSPEVAAALQHRLLDAVVTTTVGGGALWADSFTHSYRIGMYRPESWIQ